jgi:hypothetical protein
VHAGGGAFSHLFPPPPLPLVALHQKAAHGKGLEQRIAPALFVLLAPKERDTGTSPQGNYLMQPRHLPHLLQSNIRVPSYGMSMLLVGVQRIGQRMEFDVGP